MDFSIKAFSTKNAIAEQKTDCVVVGIFEGGKLTAAAKLFDDKGSLLAAMKGGDISAVSRTSGMPMRSTGLTQRASGTPDENQTTISESW